MLLIKLLTFCLTNVTNILNDGCGVCVIVLLQTHHHLLAWHVNYSVCNILCVPV